MLHHMKKAFGISAILASVMLSPQALAHAHLSAAEPAAKAEVSESPQQITLTFTEGVEPAFSGAKVVSNSGEAVATGKATSDSADKKVLHIPLSAQLTPGEYQVEWHVLSVDGHKTKGNYRFTQK